LEEFRYRETLSYLVLADGRQCRFAAFQQIFFHYLYSTESKITPMPTIFCGEKPGKSAAWFGLAEKNKFC
jgi:hypothetical protein